MLDFYYDSQQSPMPAAPVAGTLSAGDFTAFDNQNGTGITVNNVGSPAPSITIGVGGNIAFGWTGTNDGTHSGTQTNPTTAAVP